MKQNPALTKKQAIAKTLAERDGGNCAYCQKHLVDPSLVGVLREAPPWAYRGGHCGCGEGRFNSQSGGRICTGCDYCSPGMVDTGRQHDTTTDHVIPKSKGGSDDMSNLVLCCRSCNAIKGNRSLEWMLSRMQGGGQP